MAAYSRRNLVRARRQIHKPVLVAVAALALAAPAPGIAFAAKGPAPKKTRTLRLDLKTQSTGTTYTGTITGSEGKGTASGVSKPPTATHRFTFKKGSLRLTSTSKKTDDTHTTGTFKITGGTGKYKGATGKGTLTGDITAKTIRFVGKIRY